MTVIELSDEQATSLKAKAAAQCLTLEGWLQKLAAGQVSPKGRYHLSELMAQCDVNAPFSEEDRIWLGSPAVGPEA